MDEFATFLNDASGALVFGLAGLRSEHARWTVVRDESIIKDKWIMHGVSGVGQEPLVMQVWQLDELQGRLSPSGSIACFMGDQWLVTVYQQWDQVLRRKAAEELGVECSEVKVPILGDLRRLRIDVVHNQGHASRHNTGKCEFLHHWFTDGERILIDLEKVQEFMELFFSSQAYQFGRLSEEALRTEAAESHRRLIEAITSRSTNNST